MTPHSHTTGNAHHQPPAAIDLMIQRLDENVPLPAYQSEHAAGLDLHAAIDEEAELEPGDIRLIPCGFKMALPVGYEAQIRPRSGLAAKYGISMPNAPGTIDADYRGEVCVPLINLGRYRFTVKPHMRIAQMIIAPVIRAKLVQTATLNSTTRGPAGFGSTGH